MQTAVHLAAVDSVTDVLTGTEFAAGLRFGVIALVVGAVVGAAWRMRTKVPVPIAGLLMVVAAALAMDEVYEVPRDLVLVLAALALAGVIDDLFDVPMGVRFLLPVPGAWMFANTVDLPAPGWFSLAAATAIVVGGALAAEFDRRYQKRALGPAFMAVAAFGVFTTTPDTEHSRVLVAAFVVVALLGWPLLLGRLGSAGAFCAVGFLAWVVGIDGVGREGSLVGGLACLALLVAEPAASLLTRRPTRRGLGLFGDSMVAAIPAVGLQVVAVFVASRVAGFRTDPSAAAAIAAVSLVASIVVMAVFGLIAARRTS